MESTTFVNARSPFPIVVPASLLGFCSYHVAGIGLTFTPEEEALIAEMNAQAYQGQHDPKPRTYEGDLSLPPELGSIVQEFARPRLRFSREYKEALQELGQQDWPELKAKLSTNNAEEVIVYLRAYLAAHRFEVEAKDNYKKGGIGSNVLWAKVYRNKHKAINELLVRL